MHLEGAWKTHCVFGSFQLPCSPGSGYTLTSPSLIINKSDNLSGDRRGQRSLPYFLHTSASVKSILRFVGQQWGRQWLSFSWVWVYLSTCIWVWLAILNPWTISQDGINTCIVSCRHCPGLGSAPFLVRVWAISEVVYVLCPLVNWFLPSCKNMPVHQPLVPWSMYSGLSSPWGWVLVWITPSGYPTEKIYVMTSNSNW